MKKMYINCKRDHVLWNHFSLDWNQNLVRNSKRLVLQPGTLRIVFRPPDPILVWSNTPRPNSTLNRRTIHFDTWTLFRTLTWQAGGKYYGIFRGNYTGTEFSPPVQLWHCVRLWVVDLDEWLDKNRGSSIPRSNLKIVSS